MPMVIVLQCNMVVGNVNGVLPEVRHGSRQYQWWCCGASRHATSY